MAKYGEHNDVCGFANIVSYEITEPIVQQLIKKKIASGPYDGQAVIRINGGWEASQNLTYKESIVKKCAKYLNTELKNIFYTESKLD